MAGTLKARDIIIIKTCTFFQFLAANLTNRPVRALRTAHFLRKFDKHRRPKAACFGNSSIFQRKNWRNR